MGIKKAESMSKEDLVYKILDEQAVQSDEVPRLKRRRSRITKTPAGEAVQTGDDTKATGSAVREVEEKTPETAPAGEAPVKRKRGRPKKNSVPEAAAPAAEAPQAEIRQSETEKEEAAAQPKATEQRSEQTPSQATSTAKQPGAHRGRKRTPRGQNQAQPQPQQQEQNPLAAERPQLQNVSSESQPDLRQDSRGKSAEKEKISSRSRPESSTRVSWRLRVCWRLCLTVTDFSARPTTTI